MKFSASRYFIYLYFEIHYLNSEFLQSTASSVDKQIDKQVVAKFHLQCTSGEHFYCYINIVFYAVSVGILTQNKKKKKIRTHTQIFFHQSVFSHANIFFNLYIKKFGHTPPQTTDKEAVGTIASKINVTPKSVYLPILKLHSILALANLLAYNNKSQNLLLRSNFITECSS